MFERILVANRGEIACRVIRTAKKLGIATAAIYSDADRAGSHVRLADDAFRVGAAPAAESYLQIDRIVEIARRARADAVHPGYGFLAENPVFVERLEAAGITFIGPPAEAIRQMGLKDQAKQLMADAGVPVVPGYHGADQADARLLAEAEAIGWPILIKARAGGGGKGMRIVRHAAEFKDALAGARREAAASFGDDKVLLEKYLQRARHIEMQIFADGHGNILHLFERDCSLQRRHQKVIEEAPAPGMSAAMRDAMGSAAIKAAAAIGYRGAGTVEFIVETAQGGDPCGFYFMEMNTRLQVEHPVTEMITGQDLVAWQILVASGRPLPVTAQEDVRRTGHAIEARLYAENPQAGFLPSIGRLDRLVLPAPRPGMRIDSGVRQGENISRHYDPMIAKVIVHAADRHAARVRLASVLEDVQIAGVESNVAFLIRLLGQADVAAGRVDTGLIERSLDGLIGDEVPQDALVLAAWHMVDGKNKGLDHPAPFDALRGFRLWGEAIEHLGFTLAGQPVDLDVVRRRDGKFLLTAQGWSQPFCLVSREDDAVLLDLGDRLLKGVVLAQEGSLVILLKGQSIRLACRDGLIGERGERAGDDRVVAPMPGKIVGVEVKDGDKVGKGTVVIVLEAMKMEHALRAPREGVVCNLAATLGDQVEEGAILCTLEEAPG